MRPFVYFLFTLFFCSGLSAQANKHIKLGDRFFKMKDYYSAVGEYEKVARAAERKPIKKQRKLMGYYFNYAEALRQTYSYQKAEGYYEKVYNSPAERTRYPFLKFHYATVLKQVGKYLEAKTIFEEFAQINEGKNTFYTRKAKQEVLACDIANKLLDRNNLNMRVENLGDRINTRFADFGAHIIEGDLYYTSLRFDRRPTKNKRLFLDKDPNTHLVGKLMRARDNGKVRGEPIRELNQSFMSAGNSTLSLDGQYLYYTVCERRPQDGTVRCEIYWAKRLKPHVWSKGKAFGSDINLPNFTATHPSVGYDSTQGKKLLFFVSNRPEGYGRMDIWAAEFLSDTSLGQPYNLGPVINTEEDEGTPFFYNKKQTLYFASTWHPGFGGYDIFRSKLLGANRWDEPVNGGLPLNSAANDLYFVVNPDDSTGFFASNRPGSKVLTGESCCNDIYRIYLPDFDNPRYEVRLTPLQVDTPVVAVVEPKPEPVVKPPLPEPKPEPQPEPEPQPVPPVEIPVPVLTLSDPKHLDSLRIDAPSSMDNLLKTLNEQLPIALYFHDDQPDPNTFSKTSSVPYSMTYQNYLDMKSDYLSKYNEGSEGSIRYNLDTFFENRVYGEYQRLNNLLDILIVVLKQGQSLELSVRGYASALGNSKYNKTLAQRRIDCIRQELVAYDNGTLGKFIRSGQLLIKELPLGDATARSVNDAKDKRKSIYSIEAASDRRVEIVLVGKN